MKLGADASMHAEILTYSRSRGAFAGISPDGDMVQPNDSGNRAMYERHSWQNILDGKTPDRRGAPLGYAERTAYAQPEDAGG